MCSERLLTGSVVCGCVEWNNSGSIKKYTFVYCSIQKQWQTLSHWSWVPTPRERLTADWTPGPEVGQFRAASWTAPAQSGVRRSPSVREPMAAVVTVRLLCPTQWPRPANLLSPRPLCKTWPIPTNHHTHTRLVLSADWLWRGSMWRLFKYV